MYVVKWRHFCDPFLCHYLRRRLPSSTVPYTRDRRSSNQVANSKLHQNIILARQIPLKCRQGRQDKKMNRQLHTHIAYHFQFDNQDTVPQVPLEPSPDQSLTVLLRAGNNGIMDAATTTSRNHILCLWPKCLTHVSNACNRRTKQQNLSQYQCTSVVSEVELLRRAGSREDLTPKTEKPKSCQK